ncbi:MAG: CpsB/CapC family capsule biosynthesis tyrosine phosphatase [Bacteroidota bacterium]
MIFFSRNKKANIDLSWLHADMHSHLIPGIDDGVQDVQSSLAMVKGLQDLGFQKIITTPHVLGEIYPNTPETILPGLEKVRTAASTAGMIVNIHAAAEYFIDDHFQDLLLRKIPLLPISGNMVLVEFSMLTAPMDLYDVIFEMQLQNYQPVIAHPERYIYLNRKKEFYDDLKNADCYFQLNLLSLTGHYGTAVQELAEYLIKMNYYNLAGTDLHGPKHLAALQKLASSTQLHKLRDAGVLKNTLL